ncbi:DNAJ heat shock N-terminal domain-containing protein [Euphorbia peplus]|nr:DNAJ heat shock N-terminal domain-containing protein [Euphorbia peplus]
MECNKDEALKAKEIAEKKFFAKDLAGARRFALKAQSLYPGLEGIPQMVATLDVYISAEDKVGGEADWYRILGVDPNADDEAVRKQYRKLALMLHPDKNKSVGADGAFKFISEAWSMLSDKSRRFMYDQKRRNTFVPAKFSTPAAAAAAASSSKAPGPTGPFNFTKPTAKAPKSTPRTNQSSTTASSQKSKPNTFWTVCHRCNMQYEYLRVYLNHDLLCPNCHEPFLAIETAPPPSNAPKSSTTWNFSQQRQNSNNHHAAGKNASSSRANNVNPPTSGSAGFQGPDSFGQKNYQWAPFSGQGAASSVAQAATVVQQAYEKVKRDREEAQAATKKQEVLKRKYVSKKTATSGVKKRRSAEDAGQANGGSNTTNQTAPEGKASNRDFSGTVRVNGMTRPSANREVSLVGMQTILMEKAKTEIRHKISEWSSDNETRTAVINGMCNTNETDGGEKSQVTVEICNQKKSANLQDTKDVKVPSDTSGEIANLGTLIDVPDPDFQNFDKDRTEKCFEENQVWAAYDGKDGMPRLYGVIHSISSLNPFKMKIRWLNSRTNTELGPMNWIGSGFTKTCGEFRLGKYETYDSLNTFSHKVRWTKGARGAFCIYPKKGDVWALYRNWSPDWNELTPEEVVYKYDMVEVLEDYNDKEGVTTAPLVKVAGFKTVFHQHLDPREIRCIPREEMFRFSHQVPSYLLTGQEGENAPKGCRELDPAATPVDLLQVVVDVKDDGVLNNGKESNEEKI